MAIKSNIIANYISFAYVGAIGVLFTPLLYHELGAAGFGLIGFYSILQAWFVLLDFGLSASLSRICARYKGGGVSGAEVLAVFRVIQKVFVIAGLIGAFALFFLSHVIATRWFGLHGIESERVSSSVAVMGFVISLRWVSGLYRGILNGFEKQVWVSGFGILVASLRFPAAYLLVRLFSQDVLGFFLFQLVIAFVEVAVLMMKSRAELPSEAVADSRRVALKGLLGFSASIFLIGAINTILMQLDKLVISKRIGLSEFGKFSLMMSLISVIGMVSGPIASALIPALSRVHAEKKGFSFYSLYSKYWQACVILVCTIAVMLVVNAHSVLYFWAGDAQLASEFSLPMQLYSLGNSMYALASYVHYVQFASGDLSLQVRYNVAFAVIYIPMMIFAVTTYGVVGAAFTWAVCSSAGFVFITYAVHEKFFRTNFFEWVNRYFLGSIVSMVLAAIVMRLFIDVSVGRVFLFLGLAFATTVVFISGLMAPINLRRKFHKIRF